MHVELKKSGEIPEVLNVDSIAKKHEIFPQIT